MTAALRIRLTIIACALVAVFPSVANAQEAAPQLEEDPRAARYHEVERGFFVGFEVGYLGLFKTPVATPSKYPYAGSGGGQANGFSSGLHFGYDITPKLALGVFVAGANATAGSSYGAFDLMSAGLDARYAVFSRPDAFQVSRLKLYVHGRAGIARSYPSGLFGKYADSGIFRRSDALMAGGAGLEYFTRLRHFSVGIAADFVYVLNAQVPGVAITPTMRYTF